MATRNWRALVSLSGPKSNWLRIWRGCSNACKARILFRLGRCSYWRVLWASRRELNPRRAPCFEAVAVRGSGVFDTLKAACKLVLKTLG